MEDKPSVMENLLLYATGESMEQAPDPVEPPHESVGPPHDKVGEIESRVDHIGGRVETLEASVSDLEATVTERREATPPAASPPASEGAQAPLEIAKWM